jgi:hypothetical protein
MFNRSFGFIFIISLKNTKIIKLLQTSNRNFVRMHINNQNLQSFHYENTGKH